MCTSGICPTCEVGEIQYVADLSPNLGWQGHCTSERCGLTWIMIAGQPYNPEQLIAEGYLKRSDAHA